nr:DivIVA domain-containing protein [uncultured Solibaculum sp.]
MMTPVQIKNRTFEKSSFGGYRPEDVDAFLDELYEDYDKLYRENSQLVKKMQVLVEKIEEYRSEESSIQSAFLSAQKAGDAIIREAQHKADLIMQDASIKAEKMVESTQRELVRQSEALDKIQQEVGHFKQRLLSIYKEHISLISALPEPEKAPEEERKETQAEEEPAAERVVPPMEESGSAEESTEEEQLQQQTSAAPVPEKRSTPAQRTEEEIRRPLSSFGMRFGEHYDMSADDDYPTLENR